jgi:hypothetical protein
MEYGWSDAAYKVVLKNFSKASAGGNQKANPVAAIEISKLRCIGPFGSAHTAPRKIARLQSEWSAFSTAAWTSVRAALASACVS